VYLITGNDLVNLRFTQAIKHGHALAAEVRAFMKRKPYTLLTECNADRSEYALRFRVREEPSEHLGIILSDAVHQLRATLDNIAFILAGRPKGRYARQVQFPIIHPGRNGGRKAFERWAESRLKGVKGPPLTIIEGVQPYHGLRRNPLPEPGKWPPYPLSVLEHLSNLDKHRSPHLAFVAPSRYRIAASADPIRREFTGGKIEDNAVVARYWFSEPNVDVQQPGVQLILAVELPAYRKKGPLPILEYVQGMLGVIGQDIIVPLRPYLD
jgi:hypothetical protein